MTIILEGPDGAGKTTLLSDLSGHLPGMEQHPRFCTSRGGPIADLAEEVSEMTKNNILMQAGISVLGQANQSIQATLKLLS